MKKANEMWVGITKIGSETISKGSIKSKKKKKNNEMSYYNNFIRKSPSFLSLIKGIKRAFHSENFKNKVHMISSKIESINYTHNFFYFRQNEKWFIITQI